MLPMKPVIPIFGLSPPQPNYMICDHCHQGFKLVNDHGYSSDLFWRHHCLDRLKPKNHKISSVQTFGPGNQSWFHVLDSSNKMVNHTSLWVTYQTQMVSRPQETGLPSLPENYCIIHQFLHKNH